MSVCRITQTTIGRFRMTTREQSMALCYSVSLCHFPTRLKRFDLKSSFATSSIAKYPRDMNRDRGVSTRRRTGLRQPLSVSKTPLPQPVLDPARRSKYEVSEDHELWGFFHSKEKAINTPEEDYAFGRSWTVEELRGKSWEDLHALWWVCAKENNRIATASYERRRIKAGYGDAESEERDKAVRRTQRAIKQALTERWYSWSEARTLAKNDTEVDLSGSGPAYCPKDVFEDVLPNGSNSDKEDKNIILQDEKKR
ncbi:hypothetical protein EPUL_004348 [Erysiphe pulchra]|uniref:Large ribosomal subunit protein uL29m n=1 Tax=Erysiphe pulchra TaxID=225359 RepID=A0A2S4PMZ4_9PEZI|nr:hypothetical protein EPUL_004348 [Erysiphe pulchra]